MYSILKSRNIALVLISSRIFFFLYAIMINLVIHNAALHKLYIHIVIMATCKLAPFSALKYIQKQSKVMGNNVNRLGKNDQ